MRRQVHLSGDLIDHCGGISDHTLYVESIGEACRALNANYPGFKNKIQKEAEYYVLCGDIKEENALNDDTIFMNFHQGDFHICPKIAGSKSMVGAIATTVLGVVLMVVSIWVPPAGALGYGLIAKGLVFSVGLSLFAGGMLSVLSPTPKTASYGEREDANDRPSFLFDGPMNTTEQGGPVSLIYGRLLTGSTLISSALDTEDTGVVLEPDV